MLSIGICVWIELHGSAGCLSHGDRSQRSADSVFERGASNKQLEDADVYCDWNALDDVLITIMIDMINEMIANSGSSKICKANAEVPAFLKEAAECRRPKAWGIRFSLVLTGFSGVPKRRPSPTVNRVLRNYFRPGQCKPT
jgi:hypothetical protein